MAKYRGSMEVEQYVKRGNKWVSIEKRIDNDNILDTSHWRKWQRYDRNSGHRGVIKEGNYGIIDSYTLYHANKDRKIVYKRNTKF